MVVVVLSVGSEAKRVYVPILSILQPEKVATPATAATEFDVQVKVAPAVPDWIESVTKPVAVTSVVLATVLTVTTGWTVQALAAGPPPGWVVKASVSPEVAALGRLISGRPKEARPIAAVTTAKVRAETDRKRR
jgi:hypothetical protein